MPSFSRLTNSPQPSNVSVGIAVSLASMKTSSLAGGTSGVMKASVMPTLRRAGMMIPASVHFAIASGDDTNWMNSQAASGALLVLEMPQPEPSASTIEPASPSGNSATSQAKSTASLLLSGATRQRPSTIIAASPSANMLDALRSAACSLVGATLASQRRPT